MPSFRKSDIIVLSNQQRLTMTIQVGKLLKNTKLYFIKNLNWNQANRKRLCLGRVLTREYDMSTFSEHIITYSVKFVLFFMFGHFWLSCRTAADMSTFGGWYKYIRYAWFEEFGNCSSYLACCTYHRRCPLMESGITIAFIMPIITNGIYIALIPLKALSACM